MYWIYLIIFVIAVLSPDLIRGDFYLLSEKRAEEMLIFLLGTSGFLLFIWQEHQIFVQKKEIKKDERKISQTIKDLVESYSYIGEVNRKMDIMMNISFGLTEKSNLSKKKESEIYHNIIDAAKFIMKADCALLKFINVENKQLTKEVKDTDCNCTIANNELFSIVDRDSAKKIGKYLIVSSRHNIKNIRCFLMVNNYNTEEPRSIEMIKVLASQALFVSSYAGQINA